MAENESGAGTPPKKSEPKFNILEPKVPTFYVNDARFTATPWDIYIEIGELEKSHPEDQSIDLVPRAKLVMSPGFALTFALIMNNFINKFKDDLDQKVKQQAEEAAGESK
jgi:hypothetical protein